MEAVLRFLKAQCGVNLIGSVGFCWGGVAVHHLALNYPQITAGVSVYGKGSQSKLSDITAGPAWLTPQSVCECVYERVIVRQHCKALWVATGYKKCAIYKCSPYALSLYCKKTTQKKNPDV